jgi:hypothetical protein
MALEFDDQAEDGEQEDDEEFHVVGLRGLASCLSVRGSRG